MRQAAGVDHDGFDAFAFGSVNAVYQGAFMIALKAGDAGTCGCRHAVSLGLDLSQGCRAVDFGLACA